jgi:hypothetical protein
MGSVATAHVIAFRSGDHGAKYALIRRYFCIWQTGTLGVTQMTQITLEQAIEEIATWKALAELVAAGEVKTALHDGVVVFWHDNTCAEPDESRFRDCDE